MSSSREYKYKFSFVMPVYNVEQYLAETIESVLAQDIGFEENIQLILVNDGSNDGSSEVAKHYLNKYPENIIYVEQENKGVSAARNAGVELVEGKYISFLDSDDLISPDTIRKVYNFFEEHYEEVDLVSIKLEFFEAQTGPHPLNYKYETTRVVDIESDYDHIQLSGGSIFVKTDAIKNKSRFDTKLKTAEDAKLITEIVLEKMAYGLVAEPTYYYRKRASLDSAMSSSLMGRAWYVDTPKYAHFGMFSYAKEKLGYIPRYVQFLVMYDLQWRFMQQAADAVPVDVDIDAYKKTLYSLLQNIDDDIIMSQKNIHIEYKLFILRKKYGENFNNLVKREDTKYYINDTFIYNDAWRHKVFIDFISITDNLVKIQGNVGGIILSDLQFGFSVGGIFHKAHRSPRMEGAKLFLDELVYDRNGFTIEFPIENNNEHAKPILRRVGWRKELTMEGMRYSRMLPFTRGATYTVYKNFLICHVTPSLLVFVERSKYRIFMKELKYLAISIAIELKKSIRILKELLRGRQESENQEVVEDKTSASVIMLRFAYWITKPFVSKRIWLISDRVEAAGDNGEAFFRYAVEQPENGIRPLFVLPRKSSDYGRMSKIGPVIDPSTWRYKLLFLHADKVISSSADHHTINALGEKQKLIRDIVDFDFVFLQHGVTKDDQSDWLNKYKKNIQRLVTVSPMEYRSFLAESYHYSRENIVLTGFPRYDRLENKPKNKLIIMPTWRKDIVDTIDPKTNERPYSSSFKTSEYYKFYSSLLSDPRFLSALETHKIKAEFYLHPSLNKQIKDFKGSKHVKIMSFPHDYQKAFSEGSILLTDYSSVAFDFAYLKKPILYTQFDKEKFYESHTYDEGYFSYEDNGFGPVSYEYESTLKNVVSMLGKNKMETKYINRVESFFKYTDKHNSRRVYQTILNLDETQYINSVVKHHENSAAGADKALIPTYWWRYNYPVELNFGDEITPYIMKSIWGVDAIWTDVNDSILAGAGSILDILQRERKEQGLNVWGSGFIREGEPNNNPNLIFHAVRGPRTLSRIGTNAALGDPGILVNLVFKAAKEKKYKVGVVPHYVDVDNKMLDVIRNNPDYLVVDVLQTPDKVAYDISSCKYILSSSLHGLIFADSYGIPNNRMRLSDKLTGGEYKFNDYYESTGRKLIEVSPSILGKEDEIRRVMESYVPISNLDGIQKQLIERFPFKEGMK